MPLNIDLNKYCAEGTNIKEEMVDVSGNVSLKLITFNPQQPSNNPIIVFIPGWISTIDGWKDVLVEITKDFTIYYLETREKSSSQIKDKVEFSVEEIGKDIATLINLFLSTVTSNKLSFLSIFFSDHFITVSK